MRMINHVITCLIEMTKAEHTFPAVVPSVFGAMRVARIVRTDAVKWEASSNMDKDALLRSIVP